MLDTGPALIFVDGFEVIKFEFNLVALFPAPLQQSASR